MLLELGSYLLHDGHITAEQPVYYLKDLIYRVLEKFRSNANLLNNHLPPSIVRLPEKDYLSPQPHFTIKSNPAYIVKTGN
jgi:hypothetical protein